MVDIGKAWADLQPELAEAAKRERKVRSEAWLNIPSYICDVPVHPLTLEHFCLLRAAESPFIVGGDVTAGAIAQFLWIVSDEFCYDEGRKAKFLKGISDINAGRAILDIYDYIDTAFFDAPRSSGQDDEQNATRGTTIALETILIDRLAQAYGWSADEILKMPLSRIFQLLTSLNAKDGTGTASPLQDEIKRNFLKKANSAEANK